MKAQSYVLAACLSFGLVGCSQNNSSALVRDLVNRDGIKTSEGFAHGPQMDYKSLIWAAQDLKVGLSQNTVVEIRTPLDSKDAPELEVIIRDLGETAKRPFTFEDLEKHFSRIGYSSGTSLVDGGINGPIDGKLDFIYGNTKEPGQIVLDSYLGVRYQQTYSRILAAVSSAAKK